MIHIGKFYILTDFAWSVGFYVKVYAYLLGVLAQDSCLNENVSTKIYILVVFYGPLMNMILLKTF